MSRSRTHDALILRVRQSGESNREVFFLSAEEGILRAMLFGGPKSKLRSHAASYNSGTIWIYHDPVKDSRKITDFDVHSWRPGLREVYERTMAAAAMAETILAGHGGGGNWEEALALANRCLDVLEYAGADAAERILVHFLWNWAEILGIRPDLKCCARCACEAPADGILWYSMHEGEFLCPDCASPLLFQNSGEFIKTGGGARRWLEMTGSAVPSELLRISLDSESLRQAKSLVTGLLSAAFGRRLSSWDKGTSKNFSF